MKTYVSQITGLRLWIQYGIALLLLIGVVNVQAVTLPGPLVDTKWLVDNLEQVVVLDVRTDAMSFAKRPKGTGPVNPCGPGKKGKKPLVVAGHIPGAVLVPWKDVTDKRKVKGVEIKGMVPVAKDFEQLMRKSGVNNDSTIVITGKGQTPVQTALAARLYWTLKYFGHDNVALLSGGTAQWIMDKNKVKFGKSRAGKGNFKATTERKEILASLDDVAKLSLNEGGNGQLVDVRGKDVYLGLTYSKKFVTPEGKGHIPGAKNFPIYFMANSMGPAATVYSKDEIKEVAELVGMDYGKPITTFCNSGVMASLGWFVFHELMGNENVRLYDGSMHEWSQTGKPVTAMKID